MAKQVTKSSDRERAVALESLDDRSRDALLQQVRKDMLAEAKSEIMSKAKSQVTDEVRAQIIKQYLDGRKARVVAFLAGLLPNADRLATVMMMKVVERGSISEFREKCPEPIFATSQHKLTVAGLVATITNILADEKLVGSVVPHEFNKSQQKLAGFVWRQVLTEIHKDYVADPTDGIARVAT